MNSPSENISPNDKRLLVIGFGDIAERLAEPLLASGWQIEGLCRSKKESHLVTLQQGNAADSVDLEKALAMRPHQVLVTLTPDERTPQAYQAAYVRTTKSLVRACANLDFAPHILFASSTAVYSQDDGSEVDERSEAKPPAFNGRALCEAERLFEASRLPLTILRFSGIYGRERKPMQQRLRAELQNFSPWRWTNRIHIRDVVGVIEFVLNSYQGSKEPMGILLASDQHPAQQGSIENWVREQLKLAVLDFDKDELASGKRCNSLRLQSLGYRFKVQDYREGYLDGR